MATKRRARFAVGLILVALGALLLVSLATHDPHEGPFPDFTARQVEGNACGVVGAYASAYAFAMLGWTAYLLAAGVACAGLLLAFPIPIS
ncbi:MAG: DNA translocase FtsK 4TM domain-containing protein, partial [Planctomycetota bacterium]